jgi:eukaryotic-like serine/threonine-protein kinase
MGSSSTREAVVKTGDIVEGRYRIIRTLGEGGMGTVFLAEHALIKRRVAIKILHPELATDANVIERFMNEARAAGTLGHPNIVESTDMGFTHHHVPYIVFEYLEGALLTDEIYRLGGLPVRRAVRIASQIASALHAAHNAGVVHRDLKSDNVFLTDKDDAFDHVKVLDFGISRFLMLDDKQKGMVMGTPEFMAPEQITDPENVDRRADIYALGVILYEMLTARRPFASEDDPRQLLHRIVHEEPPPLMRPEVPHGLAETILGMMLAKNPDDRYQTMSDVEAALESFITRSDGTPVPSRRSQLIPLVDAQHDLNDIARNSKTIPRPAKTANTPYPGGPAADTLTPMAMKNVMLNGAAKKPYALYAMAGVGIAVGALGLMFGMRGNKRDDVAQTPQPTVQQPQPAAAMPVPKEAQKITVQLDADAPNAHVTFRRHIAGTPTSTQINATDVVELVEVSAPGYKTARYWLTFDRPTHLKAHLAKGTGLAEATEEETLVALGEVSAPAQTAIAQKVAPTPAATARTVEKPRPQAAAPASVVEKIAMAPRKIGKAAVADDIKKIEPAEVPVVAATTDEPKPETKPEPKPDPVMPEVAKPAPAEEPVAKAVEPPKVEAPVPAVARPAGIDATTVSTVVGNHKNEVQKCFADGKKKNTSLKGTLSLQLQVDAAGKVHRVQIQSTLKDPLVAACVVRSANAWRFPARAGGETATVSYPFSVN